METKQIVSTVSRVIGSIIGLVVAIALTVGTIAIYVSIVKTEPNLWWTIFFFTSTVLLGLTVLIHSVLCLVITIVKYVKRDK